MGRTLSLLVAPPMRPLLLLFFYTGFSQGFWSGVLTEQMSPTVIGYMMVVVGVAEVVGGAETSFWRHCIFKNRSFIKTGLGQT